MIKARSQAAITTFAISNAVKSVEKQKPMTFKELLEKVENNQIENNEPCMISLRRIEAKRRSLLHDEEQQEALVTRIVNTNHKNHV